MNNITARKRNIAPLLALLIIITTGCSIGTTIRTDIIEPAFLEETQLIALLDRMGDAYWSKRDLKAGFATGKASITQPSLQTKLAIDNLNSLADKTSPDYKKGLGLGYWINYLWYDTSDALNKTIPAILDILNAAGLR